jgi:membrane protease YdiL (CAAX protease family)
MISNEFFRQATSPAPRAGTVWDAGIIVSILIFSHLLYLALAGPYAIRLWRSGKASSATFVLEYSDIGASLLILGEVVIILMIFHRRAFSPSRGPTPPVANVLPFIIIVSIAGILLSVIATFLTPLILQPISLVSVIFQHLPYSSMLLWPLGLLLTLPAFAEILFRKIICPSWSGKFGTPLAIVTTSVAFAIIWPLSSPPSAFIIGLTTALLYSRSERIMPSILVSTLANLLCAGALVWQAIVRGRVS